MLFGDLTESAIIVGHQIKLEEDEVNFQLAKMVREAVALLNERHGLELGLYVPGDTTDTGVGFARNLVLGLAAVSSDCYAAPTQFEGAAVRQAVSDFPKLPDHYWHEMGIELGIETTGTAKAKPILMSWGPLCYGSICAGVSMTEDDRDEANYEFIANQDMEQMWTFEGLDGESMVSVEFDDIRAVDVSKEAVQGYFAQVSKHDEPSLFLTCRYD